MVDFGSDIAGIDDVDAELSFVEGVRCLVEDLACKLGNVPGTTEDVPTDGYDLTMLIGSVIDRGEVESRILEQMTSDDRVASARVAVEQIGELLQVTIQIVTSTGVAFTMILEVSAVSVALADLNLQEAA